MKTVAIIQARMGSTRLPGKVLLDLAGEPMLARVVNRVRRARRMDEVLVATTTEPSDDALAALCSERGWLCFRGSEDDVLDRYYQAALSRHADVVVRITSDCPLIEPIIIDAICDRLESHGADYASNVAPRTHPRGLDTEAFLFSTLKTTWREARDPASREHVTLFIRNHPELFSLASLTHDGDHSDLRWTVDTAEDFELARRIYGYFGHDHFSWQEVLAVLVKYPPWSDINRHVPQKAV